MLAAEARAAGRDPAADPIPGLTRDVMFAATADEEAGGLNGIGWIVAERPELAPGGGRDQRVRRRRDDVRRPAVLPDRRRREGLRGLSARPSTGRGATARCRATTTPRSGRRRPSTRLPSRAARADARDARRSSTRRRRARSTAEPGPASCARSPATTAARRGRARRAVRADVGRGSPGAAPRHDQPERSSTPASSTTSSRARRRSRSTAGSCPGTTEEDMRETSSGGSATSRRMSTSTS